MKAISKNWLLNNTNILKTTLLFVGLFYFNTAYTQVNLVPNGSFEILDTCPYFGSQLYFAKPWYAPQNNSTDLYSTCDTIGGMSKLPCTINCDFSYQYAKNGNTIAGFFVYNSPPNYKEYLQVKLNDTLKVSHCYLLKFYVNQPNMVKLSSNGIGAYFSSKPDTQMLFYNGIDPTILPYQPQVMKKGNPIITDTMGWVTIAGIFTSKGTETFLTIGSFTQDSLLDTLTTNFSGYAPPYYFVDDVSVIEATSQNMQHELALHDTTITEGTAIKIGDDEITGVQYAWYVNNNFIDTTGIIIIHPTTQTTYIRQMSWCGFTWSDTVVVSVSTGMEQIKNSNKIELLPNPTTNDFSIILPDYILNCTVTITNALGQLQYHQVHTNEGVIAIQQTLPKGLYFVTIKNNSTNENTIKKLIIE